MQVVCRSDIITMIHVDMQSVAHNAKVYDSLFSCVRSTLIH